MSITSYIDTLPEEVILNFFSLISNNRLNELSDYLNTCNQNYWEFTDSQNYTGIIL